LVKTRWRQQALTWLRADLAMRTRQLTSGQPADRAAGLRALRQWQEDSALAGIRDAAAVARLPARERETCRKFWVETEALQQKARQKPKGE
jgi:hypothetical protein